MTVQEEGTVLLVAAAVGMCWSAQKAMAVTEFAFGYRWRERTEIKLPNGPAASATLY